jgi:hypothetical protein
MNMSEILQQAIELRDKSRELLQRTERLKQEFESAKKSQPVLKATRIRHGRIIQRVQSV